MQLKRIRVFSLLLAVSFLLSLIPSSNPGQGVKAQSMDFVISGRVTDDSNNGIEGVTIMALQSNYQTMLPLVMSNSTTSNPPIPPINSSGTEQNYYSALTDFNGAYNLSGLPAGRYELSAFKEGEDFDPISYTVVSSNAGSPYDFQTTTIPTVYSPLTNVLSEDALSKLIAVSEDGINYTFLTQTPELAQVGVGDIILGGITTITPEGFLRRVTSVQTSDSHLVFATEQATLAEAFESLSVYETHQMTPSDIQEINTTAGIELVSTPSVNGFGDFNWELTDAVLYDDDGNLSTQDDQIVANGNIYTKPDIKIRIRIEHFDLKEFYFSSTTTVQTGFTVSSKLKLSVPFIQKSLLPRPIKLGVIYVGPLIVTPTLDLVAGISGSISGGLSEKTTSTSTSTAGIWFLENQIQIQKKFENNFSYEPRNWDFTQKVSFKASIGPKVSAKIYGVLGAYARAGIGVKLDIAPNENPLITMKGGLEVSVGASITIIDKEVLNLDIKAIEVWYLIYSLSTSTDNTQPNPAQNPSPTEGAVNQSLLSTLSWTGSDPDFNMLVYDVYLDPENSYPTTKVADHQSVTSISPGPLTANTTYYWKVVTFDEHGASTASSVWYFTTDDGVITPGEMVFVPAGEFQMGCDLEHNGGYPCNSSELPLHTVFLDAYYIDKTEITNAQYAECVNAGVCYAPAHSGSHSRAFYYGNQEYSNYPVIYVNWYLAQDYCAWAGKRLPTEAEWEKAARGTTPRAYPWVEGDPTCSLANSYNDATGNYCVGDTSAVGSYPAGASLYGALDMAGNVWEWVSDWWAEDYYGNSPASNPTGPSSGYIKVARGGDWSHSRHFLLTAVRAYDGNPDGCSGGVGFRCVSPEP